ncbi:molybdopterin synthase catalytic subunit [Salinibacillus kushneri]|uniref:Molybdopterin synthase catalytic subunit n=1 Tax=Salinibacillus kushneri TaxID=237682 RepID=A0A1I0IQ67_9BACI|nr:molybdenum cofactor biosynthesis protein MoaE [Salinibacillus kushneri]SET98606.1 molybdopterin synthase catalytic subunit [Salinibacillus kushneri]
MSDEVFDKPFVITEKPLSTEMAIQHVSNPKAGAVNLFVGTVREWTGDKQTQYLEYEAYDEMAEKMLQKIGNEIKEKWSEACVSIQHRIGRMDISDIAVIVAVSTPHRNESFEASRHGIERIKQMVPIWKKEFWTNGESWVGNQQETIAYPKGEPIDGGEANG